MIRGCFTVFGTALVFLPSLLAAQQATPADAVKGKRLYVQTGCFECHGYAGQGGASGPRIAPWTLPAESLISYVRRPAGQMPLYTDKVLPDNDLRAIWSYLKSIRSPQSAKEIPLLKDAGSR